jgi:hypothetical protein
MITRRHGSKPTLALWMLVAVADVALLAAAVGPLVTTLFAGTLVLAVGAFVAMRTMTRRTPAHQDVMAVAGMRMLAARRPPETRVAVRRRA